MKYFARILCVPVLFFCLNARAQNIPNPGFESWINFTSYEDPVDWVCLNLLSGVALGSNPISVTKTTGGDAHSGSFGLQLETIELISNPVPGVIPDTVGVTFTGQLNGGIDLTRGYFYAGQPDTLSFWFKYFPQPGDTGGCYVAFTRFNLATGTSDLIGEGFLNIDTTTNNFELAKVEIEWYNADIPDTANISVLSSAGDVAVVGSYIIVDDFLFSDALPTISQIETDTLLYDLQFVNPPIEVSETIVAWNDTIILNSAMVRISNNFVPTEDSLFYTSMFGIIGSYSAASGVLQLNGTASFADYQAALRSVKYKNYNTTPTMSVRKVDFQINDGMNMSNIGYRYVHVMNSVGFDNLDIPKGLSIHPNPAKSELVVSNIPKEAKRIVFYDMLGNSVLSFTSNSAEQNINLEGVSSGIYLVNVLDKKGKVLESKKLSISK